MVLHKQASPHDNNTVSATFTAPEPSFLRTPAHQSLLVVSVNREAVRSVGGVREQLCPLCCASARGIEHRVHGSCPVRERRGLRHDEPVASKHDPAITAPAGKSLYRTTV